MNTAPPARRRRARTGAGFTLVEILVVISIIGVLVALLVPAIASAVRGANEAVVSGDIQQFAQSLASFKNQYGEYPPSRIVLNENGFYDVSSTATLASLRTTFFAAPALINGNPDIGDYNAAGLSYSATDLSYGQLAARSLRYLRKFFPQAQFSTTGPLFASNTPANRRHDFNGNGVLDQAPILLEGHECLVFFLGGIPTRAADSLGMGGFARSPGNPFQPEALTTNRTPALFEFKNDRLIDDDGDGIPGYVDSLGAQGDARFFAYFSGYAGGGYDPNDVNFAEPDADTNGATAIARYFRGGGSGGAGTTSPAGPLNLSAAPNPYTTSFPVPDGSGVTPVIAVNRDSFQIVSAGRDRLYGFGGRYDGQSSTDRLPLGPATAGSIQLYTPARNGIRDRERDNVANFSAGRLE
jgi:general secretion pathway protein G